LLTDGLIFIGLLTLCAFWVIRRFPHRRTVLLAASAVLTLAAFNGVHAGRWQALPAGLLGIMSAMAVLVGRFPSADRRPPPVISGLALWLAAFTASALLYILPVARMPDPTGPHAVGRLQFDLTDPMRLDPVGKRPRRLTAYMWYPAAEASKRAPVASPAEARSVFAGLARSMGLPGFVFHHVSLTRSSAAANAPVKPLPPGSSPIVLFSHGMGSYPAQNTALMEELASHGYIAISTAHAGDTPAIVFTTGEVELYPSPSLPESDEALNIARTQRFFGSDYDERMQGLLNSERIARLKGDPLRESARSWLADRLLLSEALRSGQLPEAVREILVSADPGRIVHAGMSFGGSMSVTACGLDPACRGAINLDGGDYHFTYLGAAPPEPLLMVHADWTTGPLPPGVKAHPPADMAFNDFSYEPPETAGLEPKVYRVRIRGVTHAGLSDFGLFLRPPLRGLLTGKIKGEDLTETLNDIVLGFLDRHVRNKDNGFPQVHFSRNAEHLAVHEATGVREWWLAKPSDERSALQSSMAALVANAPQTTESPLKDSQ